MAPLQRSKRLKPRWKDLLISTFTNFNIVSTEPACSPIPRQHVRPSLAVRPSPIPAALATGRQVGTDPSLSGAARPHLELIGGCGSERIPCPEQDLVPGALELRCELADGCGLA